MNNYPSDPETGVCLSGGLACLSRHKAVRQTISVRQLTIRIFQEETGVRDLQEREEGNIGSIITMLITDQVLFFLKSLKGGLFMFISK